MGSCKRMASIFKRRLLRYFWYTFLKKSDSLSLSLSRQGFSVAGWPQTLPAFISQVLGLRAVLPTPSEKKWLSCAGLFFFFSYLNRLTLTLKSLAAHIHYVLLCYQLSSFTLRSISALWNAYWRRCLLSVGTIPELKDIICQRKH